MAAPPQICRPRRRCGTGAGLAGGPFRRFRHMVVVDETDRLPVPAARSGGRFRSNLPARMAGFFPCRWCCATFGQGDQGRNNAGNRRRELRLHHLRRRLCRLRARQPAFRRSREPRAAARRRRARQLDLVPHSGRLPLCYRQSAGRLAVQDRRRTGAQRPFAGLSARQGAGRLLGNQCNDLYARTGARL